MCIIYIYICICIYIYIYIYRERERERERERKSYMPPTATRVAAGEGAPGAPAGSVPTTAT